MDVAGDRKRPHQPELRATTLAGVAKRSQTSLVRLSRENSGNWPKGEGKRLKTRVNHQDESSPHA